MQREFGAALEYPLPSLVCVLGWASDYVGSEFGNTQAECTSPAACWSSNQREGVGLLEYQAKPSLRGVTHGGVCVHLVIDHPETGQCCGPSGQAANLGMMAIRSVLWH
jgi:hypothetical protein